MCEGGGGRRRAGEGSRDTESKTRTPHKVVGNKVMNIFENKTSYDKLHNNDNDTNDLMMMKTSDSLTLSEGVPDT